MLETTGTALASAVGVAATGGVASAAEDPVVETGDVEVFGNRAHLFGTLQSFGAGASSAEVYFEFERARNPSPFAPFATDSLTVDQTGEFGIFTGPLEDDTTWDYWAVAETPDGDRDEGAVRSFYIPPLL